MSDEPTRTEANVMIDALFGLKPQLPDFDAVLRQVERVAKAIDLRLIVEPDQGIEDHRHAGAAKGINVFLEQSGPKKQSYLRRYLRRFRVCIRLSDDEKSWVGELAFDDDAIRREILDQIAWYFIYDTSH